MEENNMNQTPDTANGYPQSENGYPQSANGYPQSGAPYPQSGENYVPGLDVPYPVSVYEEKKSKGWIYAIIAVVAVLIIALVVTLVVAMRNRSMMGMMPPPPPPPTQAVRVYDNFKDYEKPVSKLVIDDKEIDLPQPMLEMEDLHFISLQDFANIFDYETTADTMIGQATISKGDRRISFTNDAVSAVVMTGENKQEKLPLIAAPMMFTNGQVYIPLRSLKDVFELEEIEWDEKNTTINITTNGDIVPVTTKVEKTEANIVTTPPPPPPGGGMAPPPPPGGGMAPPPAGGQPPQGGQGGMAPPPPAQ